jgi:2-phospho-L-lactate/phosphoenolpyruvate guanylyltransferase
VRTTAIVPVKRFANAKQRLVDAIGPPARATLTKAMLADVLAALTATELVERVIVVSGEGRAEKIALHHAQRVKTPIEILRDPHDAGHSQAATLGIVRAKALGAGAVALLPGDCPLLDAAELDDALARMQPESVAVIPDRHGTGTNALLMCPPDAIGPAFGPDSHGRHTERARKRGMEVSTEALDSLALDLDTADDLAALDALLVAEPHRAPETSRALAAFGQGEWERAR